MNDWVVGVDLGGTKIEVDLVDPQSRIAGRRRIPTKPWEGPQCVVERIAECVQELSAFLPEGARIAGLGICSPGPVDHETGTLTDPPNLTGLHNAPLRRMLAERLQMPVSLDHDAKAAALGEFYFGAGRGEQHMVYVVVGTGVGGAIITNGTLFRGPYNSAGEIGHVTMDRDGDRCSCGRRGCVETLISGPWLARRYVRALADAGKTAPPDPAVTGEGVVRLAEQGDPDAQRVLDHAGESLGIAIATMAMIVNVDLFVIGGSVAKAGDLLFEPARRALPQHSYRSVGCEIQIVPAELGDDGPILGCAWLARQAVEAAATHRHAAAATRLLAAERAQLERVEGIVFDIQRFSLHDGSGIRTNVFLKGCAMRCPWCANPESQHRQPDLTFTPARCINCGQFSVSCADCLGRQGVSAGGDFAARVEACPTCAIRMVGKRRTAGEVIAEVLRDQLFYADGGGITLTGGEPTLQPRLAEAVLRLARDHGLSTAMETSGYTRWKILERLIPYLDQILFDVKHMDAEAHRSATGVDNVLILSNLEHLAALGAPLTIRVPLIPGFNATDDSIEAIAHFVAGLPGAKARKVDVLPYHELGRPKYRALNRDYPWEGHQRLAEREVEHFAQLFAAHCLTAGIGG